MLYPPAGAVSEAVNVIVTGDEIVAVFKAVTASASVLYEVAKPDPPFVVTCELP